MPTSRPEQVSCRRRPLRGTTLLEALVACLVLALGMLAVARLQASLRLDAELARQRSEAVRFAQEDIETLRAFATIGPAPGMRSFDGIVSASRTLDAAHGDATSTVYTLQRVIGTAAASSAKTASVTVSWHDRRGAPQQVALDSVIAGNDPALSGALGLARGGTTARGAFGRSTRLPVAAKDLGDGRSAFKPVGGGTVALLLDNASGRIVGRCGAVAAALTTADLTSAALGACDGRVGNLLSGVVRFAAGSPPDAAHGHDLPLAFSMAVALAGSGYPAAPLCSVEAVSTPTGDRFAAYRCAVYPAATGLWSGRVTLVPSGWTIGTGTADRRVCRYSSDLDGSGAIDTPLEHPAAYVGVDASLSNQNYLVIAGGAACPTGSPIRVAGDNRDVDVDLSTVQHQP